MNISVILCTYNCASFIQPTLKALSSLEKPQNSDWELIVIDNDSSDNTYFHVTNHLENQKEMKWKIIREFKRGLTFARMRGVEAAEGELIIFCDDDNILSSDYLRHAWDFMKKNPRCGIAGGKGQLSQNLLKISPNWFHLYKHVYAIGPQAKIPQNSEWAEAKQVWGAGMVVRKQILRDLQSIQWEPICNDRTSNTLLSAGGDTELSYACKILGYQVAYIPSLSFIHNFSEERLSRSKLKEMFTGFAKANPILEIYLTIRLGETPRGPIWIAFLINFFIKFLHHSNKNSPYFKSEGKDNLIRYFYFRSCIYTLLDNFKIDRNYRQLMKIFGKHLNSQV